MLNLNNNKIINSFSYISIKQHFSTASTSTLLDLRATNTYSRILISLKKFLSFPLFLKALNQSFRLDTTTSKLPNTCVKVYLLYISIFFISSSAAVNFLTSIAKSFNMPFFVHVILKRFATPTVVSSIEDSSLSGKLVNDLSVQDLVVHLYSIDHDTIHDLFDHTMFSHSITRYQLENFIIEEIRYFANLFISKEVFTPSISDEKGNILSESELLLADCSFVDDYTAFSIIFDGFDDYQTIFMRTDMKPHYVNQPFIGGVTTHLNMHRFRNSTSNLVFVCNSHSLSNVGSNTLNEFGCFFQLYNPDFFQDRDLLHSFTGILPSDKIVSVVDTQIEVFLQFLFTLAPQSRKTNPKSPNRDRVAGGGTALQSIKNEVIPDNNRGYSTLSRRDPSTGVIEYGTGKVFYSSSIFDDLPIIIYDYDD